MKTRSLIAPAFAIAILGGVVACASSTESSTTSSSTTSSSTTTSPAADGLVGEWTMTSLEDSASGEFQAVPYQGQIIISSSTASVQAMNPDATAPDGPYTVNGYEAYYGPVTVDADAGSFELTVESAAVRDLIGQTLTRNYELSGDTLVLTPVDPEETWRVTYDRQTD